MREEGGNMVYSESIKIFSKPWIWAAAILGVIQGISWTILSIMSICFYHEAIEVTSLSATDYGYWILQIFHNPVLKFGDVLSPRTFNFFMFIYMLLSFIWLCLSAYLTWAMIRNKWNGLMNGLAGWAILTLLISALDIILMSLVAADLVHFQNNVFPSNNTAVPPDVTTLNALFTTTTELTTVETTTLTTDGNIEDSEAEVNLGRILRFASFLDGVTIDYDVLRTIVSTAYGIVMTLAARGYILWVANVIVAVIMIVVAVKMSKEDRPSLLPFIDAYATESRPPFDLSHGNTNESFQHDDSFEIPSWSPYKKPSNNPLANGNGYRGPKSPADSTTNTLPMTSPSHDNNFSFSKPIDNSYERTQPQYEKVAKIGKSGGRRSPPQHIPPPNVPNYYYQQQQQQPPQVGGGGGRNFPYIPDPDYTPPGSPTRSYPPKGVLRPKSNYVL